MGKDVGHATEEYYELIKGRAERRFDVIDHLPIDVRHVVHEYGWASVKILMDLGVTKPNQLRHIIQTIRGER